MASSASLLRQYGIVTGNYWAFTLTDGALRMLVVLYFYGLGYSPLAIALLFVFYEVFGVITNLVGGWLGARFGLNRTMNTGLALQILALCMLLAPADWLSVTWVMAAQALSGIAKDLNKMSAKSAIKMLVPSGADAQLYRWVALLTGSKNALKGVGFFLGGMLLAAFGFQGAVTSMAIALTVVWVLSILLLKQDLGKASGVRKFTDVFSKSPAINRLSAARMFLFGARDVWFVVALPVFLSQQLQWGYSWVSGFLACWVIGYGIVQSQAPRVARFDGDAGSAWQWALALSVLPALMAVALFLEWQVQTVLVGGLILFGVLFALNSALHSYLIVSYADADGVSLDIGFYYMANAMGRLLGTVLSGWLYQTSGLALCLVVSAAMVVIAAVVSQRLPAPSHSVT